MAADCYALLLVLASAAGTPIEAATRPNTMIAILSLRRTGTSGGGVRGLIVKLAA